jgi:hypothetical protein
LANLIVCFTLCVNKDKNDSKLVENNLRFIFYNVYKNFLMLRSTGFWTFEIPLWESKVEMDSTCFISNRNSGLRSPSLWLTNRMASFEQQQEKMIFPQADNSGCWRSPPLRLPVALQGSRCWWVGWRWGAAGFCADVLQLERLFVRCHVINGNHRSINQTKIMNFYFKLIKLGSTQQKKSQKLKLYNVKNC